MTSKSLSRKIALSIIPLLGLALLMPLGVFGQPGGRPGGTGLGQRPGSGPGGRPGGSRPGNPPRKPTSGPPVTNGHGKLTSFTPQKERGEEDPIGTMKVKLDDKRSVTIEVGAGQKIPFGNKQVEGDDIERIMLKGIMIDVSWDETKNKKNRRTNVLKNANFPTMEVSGEVNKYDEKDETVLITVTPRGAITSWPDLPPKPNQAQQVVRPRKLKFKLAENASELLDETGRAISLADLTQGKKVCGGIVLGRPGLIVTMHVLGEGETCDTAGQGKPDPGGKQGPPITPRRRGGS